MQNFGRKWTIDKMDIFIKYVKAYLEIMKEKPYWSLIYFDGFAGSCRIPHSKNGEIQLIEKLLLKYYEFLNQGLLQREPTLNQKTENLIINKRKNRNFEGHEN